MLKMEKYSKQVPPLSKKQDKYSVETKINLVMGTMKFVRGIKQMCREKGIPVATYYKWRNQFLEAGRYRLMKPFRYFDVLDEITTLRNERTQLTRDLRLSQNTIQALRLLLSKQIIIRKYKKYSPSDKEQIVKTFLSTEIPRRILCREIGISEGTIRGWVRRYRDEGYQGLEYKKYSRLGEWNRIPQHIQDIIKHLSLEYPYMGYSAMQWYLLDRYGYKVCLETVRSYQLKSFPTIPEQEIVKAPRKYPVRKTHRINEEWQTDFTRLKYIGRKWFYLGAVIDVYSRYILGWHLSLSQSAEAAICCIKKAQQNAMIEKGSNKCIIRTDRGPCYKNHRFQSFCKHEGYIHKMAPPHALYPRMKMERWFKTIKEEMKTTSIKTENDLALLLERYITFYNNIRSHIALDNVRPADVYYGRKEQVLAMRQKIILASQHSRD